jgi:uncharacterized SAM-binding protein YcdF (DUF218 family)
MGRKILRWLRSCLRVAQFSLLGIGLFVVAILVSPATSWYARMLAGSWDDSDGDVLIVLAGSNSEDGIMGESTYLRCAYAVRAVKNGSFRHVVLAGFGAATYMRDFLIFHGIPAGIVQTETRSKSTRENALFTRTLIGSLPGRKVLLTSDYHMFRARRTFQRAGIDVLALPFPDAIKRSQHLEGRMPSFITEGIESAKIVYYFAHGWI